MRNEDKQPQWVQQFTDNGFTKFMLNRHKGTMYEYTQDDNGLWELVSTTNEWRCIRDVFPQERYNLNYK